MKGGPPKTCQTKILQALAWVKMCVEADYCLNLLLCWAAKVGLIQKCCSMTQTCSCYLLVLLTRYLLLEIENMVTGTEIH